VRRLGSLLLITLAAVMSAVAPAAAGLKASDAAATHAYLEATIALHQAQARDYTSVLKVLTALEVQVKGECPRVLVGAPPHVNPFHTNALLAYRLRR
jgi:hypothetical protein